MDHAERSLQRAAEIAETLRQLGIETALIGGVALAVHGYPRDTRDIDLASDVDPFTSLRAAETALRARGFDAQPNEPDAQSPLGGVLTVRGDDFDPVQIVNLYNPLGGGHPSLGREVIAHAAPAIAGSPLRVVDVPHLIALKLYAGGPNR